jgi:excisionase family DNA binding protein
MSVAAVQAQLTGRKPGSDSPPQAPRAYTIDGFCRAFGIGRTSVYKLIGDGKLRTVMVAGRRLIPADAAEALLQNGEGA